MFGFFSKCSVFFGTYINGGKSGHPSSEGEGLFCSPLTPMIRYVRSVRFYYSENRTIKRLFGA